MPTYTQDKRPLSVQTPLGKDVLLLVGMAGHEAISELFNFHLNLLAEDASKVKFDKLLGQKITVALALPNEKERYFNGICNRVSQGGRSEGDEIAFLFVRERDRKSTRLNSSHVSISYAVFCLKKKKKIKQH